MIRKMSIKRRVERLESSNSDEISMPDLIVLTAPGSVMIGYEYLGKEYRATENETLDDIKVRLNQDKTGNTVLLVKAIHSNSHDGLSG